MTVVTNRGTFELTTGATVWLTSTIKAMLLDSQTDILRTPNVIADIVARELTGVANYVGGFNGAGRRTLTGKTYVEDDPNNDVVGDAADVLWTLLGTGGRIGAVALVREATSDADSPVLMIHDLNRDALPASAAGAANPATLTFATPHGLVTGDFVTITGAAGGTWATINGRRQITVVSATQISLNGLNGTGFGAYTANSAQVRRPVPTNGGDFTANWDPTGIFAFSTD